MTGKPRTPEQDAALFWSRVDRSGTCWVWTGDNKGGRMPYGRMTFRGKLAAAHRVSWTLNRGEIPEGLWVLHRCDNPRCVRPDHLFLGTHQDNMDDMASKGRQWLQRNPKGMSGSRHWARRKPERVRRGTKHHGAQLTEADVVAIRESYARGAGASDLAAQYGVRASNIYLIARGVTWTHVGGPRTTRRQKGDVAA